MIAPVHSTKKLLSKAERPRFHWFRTITFLFFSFLEHSLGIATFHHERTWYLPINYGVAANPGRFIQGAKKVSFTACHSGKLLLACTSPKVISTSPLKIIDQQDWLQFCNLNFSQNFTCPSGKLSTEFTSPIEKSTSPGLLDTTFFARWFFVVTLPCPKCYSATS